MKTKASTIRAVPQMRHLFKKQRSKPAPFKGLGLNMNARPSLRVRSKQLAGFTRQLSTLLEARFPLANAVAILARQTPHAGLNSTLEDILSNLRGGAALSQSLKQHPKVFDDFYVSLVQVGEKGGMLDATLDRLARYLEQMVKLRRKVLTAMTYPFVIILVAGGAMAFMLVAVVPTFADMFQDFGSQLPGPTQFLLDVSQFLKSNSVYLILVGLILTLLFTWVR